MMHCRDDFDRNLHSAEEKREKLVRTGGMRVAETGGKIELFPLGEAAIALHCCIGLLCNPAI